MGNAGLDRCRLYDSGLGGVLVVDRWRSLAQSLVRVLEASGIKAESAGLADAAPAAAAGRPAVVLLDGDADPGEVEAAVATIRHGAPEARLLVLVDHATDHSISVAERIGARGCLTRQMTADELVDAVAEPKPVSARSAMRTSAWVPASKPTRSEQVLVRRLSARERQVLDLLAVGPSNAEIARRLGISPNTVRTHVQNLLFKLDAGSRLEAAMLARRAGLGSAAWAVTPEVGVRG